VVVIEGAGSPAEINLRASDVVNMAVARLADAPVLLAADIDCGGVFAALLGTLALLEPADRARVRGLLVNRFRGDVSLLAPGLADLSARGGCPVLGVVPYLHGLHLPEEDSQVLDIHATRAAAALDIAVLRLPRIANFDDFGPLAASPGVALRYVDAPARLGVPDLVIVPGTKSTLADLAWLRATGLGAALLRLAAAGVPVLGICGGFQMLGRRLRDPAGLDGAPGEAMGLGLLDAETVFAGEKATREVTGEIVAPGDGVFGRLAGQRFDGYEIHVGRTSGSEAPLALLDGARRDGAVSADGLVAGSYVHGLLHARGLRAALLGALAARHGVTLPGADASADDPYDRLADAVAGSVDLPRLYALCGLPVRERVR
jgi:adenosylcobyric acid synthase